MRGHATDVFTLMPDAQDIEAPYEREAIVTPKLFCSR
jgi:hypothetical protein